MISIVMAYHNRYYLLDYTLESIAKTSHKDFEIIIVDDFSSEKENLLDLKDKFSFLDIKIIKMDRIVNEKNYFNPCIVYNVGFENASGEKIILQNPECCHIGDVISYTDENLSDENYLSFHCYACTAEDLPKVQNNKSINFLNNRLNSGGCWYNHKIFRPASFHFTTAISRKNLQKLNGFDERFANGRDYDDNELLLRILRLGLNIEYIEEPYVIHQYHEKVLIKENFPQIGTNKKLYRHVRKKENNVFAYNNGKLILGNINES